VPLFIASSELVDNRFPWGRDVANLEGCRNYLSQAQTCVAYHHEWAPRTESYRTVHPPYDSVRLALDTIEREPNIPPVRYGTIILRAGIWPFGSVR